MTYKFNLFLVLVLMDCSEDPGESLGIPSYPKEVTGVVFDSDTLTLEIPGTFHELPIGRYSLNVRYPDIMCGFDERNRQIEIFDFSSYHYLDSIPIPEKGPNGTAQVTSVYYHNPDSIFVLDAVENRVLLYNSNGIIQQVVHMTGQSAFRGLHPHNNNNECPIFYSGGKVYFTLRSLSKNGDYTIPLIGYYDMKTQRFGTLDISYPSHYHTGYFGFYEYINTSFINDRLYINYPADPKIYIYDLEGELLKIVDPGEDFPVVQPIAGVSGSQIPDANTQMNHLFQNPLYHRLMPLAGGKYFLHNGRDVVPEDREGTLFAFTILYNQDFSQMHVIRKNLYPFSIGNDYFYYALDIEQSDRQQLEQWQIVEWK